MLISFINVSLRPFNQLFWRVFCFSFTEISRDGHKLPTNHDLSPVTVQAYYDEMKLSLNAPSAQPEARRPSPNLDMSNANGAIFNYDRFVPKGPPSHYIPPDANASTLSCDANINTDINVTMAWNSPPPNYSDINSNNLPLLTCLGIKNSITEDQTSQNSMKSSLNVDSEDLNSNLDSWVVQIKIYYRCSEHIFKDYVTSNYLLFNKKCRWLFSIFLYHCELIFVFKWDCISYEFSINTWTLIHQKMLYFY